MARWLQYFDLDQFHLIDSEHLIRDPINELYRVETFLGLQHRLGPEKFYYNKTRGYYCMRRTDNATADDDDGIDVESDENVKCLSPSKGRQHPHVDPVVIAKLQQFFRDHNQRFCQMVGRNFTWCNDN